MVFCSLKEAYGSEFETSDSRYTAPPCTSANFSPHDPYSTNSPSASEENPSAHILNKIQYLEQQIETFVSGGGPVMLTGPIATQNRLENILHAVLLSICVSLVMQNIM